MESHFTQERWRSDLYRLGVVPKTDLFPELEEIYSGSNRFYHNRQHIAECLSLLDEHQGWVEKPSEIAIALWFHDAIYDTHRSDNEERSADWAVSYLSEEGVETEVGERIRHLILVTKHSTTPITPDEQLLVDIDLAILGQSVERFREYDGAIRREYAWVPWEKYVVGRTAVLNGFLHREHLYNTSVFQTRYESIARTNLQTAIATLSSSDLTSGSG
jgi:predicted metal-dependent HD superfamily phosphohydrolase